jgi:hypothetical protein
MVQPFHATVTLNPAALVGKLIPDSDVVGRPRTESLLVVVRQGQPVTLQQSNHYSDTVLILWKEFFQTTSTGLHHGNMRPEKM